MEPRSVLPWIRIIAVPWLRMDSFVVHGPVYHGFRVPRQARRPLLLLFNYNQSLTCTFLQAFHVWSHRDDVVSSLLSHDDPAPLPTRTHGLPWGLTVLLTTVYSLHVRKQVPWWSYLPLIGSRRYNGAWPYAGNNHFRNSM